LRLLDLGRNLLAAQPELDEGTLGVSSQESTKVSDVPAGSAQSVS
jgi:hypothetical protein